jgi:hypothetical protein
LLCTLPPAGRAALPHPGLGMGAEPFPEGSDGTSLLVAVSSELVTASEV